MKKIYKYTETRSWYFKLDVDEKMQPEKALTALQGTEGFNYYLTDRAEDEYAGKWSETPEDENPPCIDRATEYFRGVAERELNEEARDMVLKSLNGTE